MRSRVIGAALLLTSAGARAGGYFELSGNGSYFRYNNGLVGGVPATTTIQRWGGGIAYRFLSNTAIELAYSNSKTSDVYGQDLGNDTTLELSKTTIIENTSLSLILDFADRKAFFRPFIRGGGGYMTRKYSIGGKQIDQTTGESLPLKAETPKYNSASAEAGLGFKVFLVDSIALETSFNVYATDLDKPEIYLHYSASAGLRYLF